MATRWLVDATNEDAQRRLVELLAFQHEYIVVDIESTGLNPYHGDKIIGLALYFPATDESFYVVARHPENNVNDEFWRAVLHRLPDAADTLVLFNAKFDLHFLGLDGMRDPHTLEDVLIAAHLLNENEELSHGSKQGAYQLKRLAAKYLGAEAVADENELKRIAKERGLDPKKDMWLLPGELVAPYAMADVEITWGLRQRYVPALEAWRQFDLYRRRCEFELKALLRMERNGLKIDLAMVEQHRLEIEPRMAEIEMRFQDEMRKLGVKLTDKKDERYINLNAHAQVKQFFLLHGRKLESTDKLTLEGLANAGDGWAAALLEYRTLARANQNYYIPYTQLVDPNGFIHTNLNAVGTVTGRLSSDHPNFQNIPRNSKRYKVKQVFVPRPGYALMSSDYKQLELRLAVHYSNEETMRQMFNEGLDMHQWTADRLGVSRQIGKNANFGLIYGMGAVRASTMFGTSVEEAERIVKGWRELYPAFGRALISWQDMAERWRDRDGQDGGNFQFVRLFNGRIRHYQEYLKYPMKDADGNEIPPPYRDAWNFYIQGTGAAITEESILRLCIALPDNEIFKPVLTIHDAFESEIALDYVKEIVPVIEEQMTCWFKSNPRLGVDTEFTLTNWYEMQSYTPEAFDEARKVMNV